MAASKWNVDVAHSQVEFSVRHMMISNVRGAFHKFDGDITADPQDLTTAQVKFTIETASVDTKDEGRDTHLKSGDFFDSEKFQNITFQSTKITNTGDDTYDVTGDLTIRDVTKPVTFKTTMEGVGKDPWGNEKVGISAQGTLNRKDFGLVWNVALETGGVLVSDTVKLSLELQASRA